MNLLANKVGIVIEYVDGYSWAQFLGMMKTRELDIILNIAKTAKRKKYMIFTEPILDYVPSIISRKGSKFSSMDSLAGKKLVVVDGYWYYDVIKKYYPDIMITRVQNKLEALKEVSYGNADATIGNSLILEYIWLNRNIINLKISGEAALPMKGSNIERIGVRKDWPLLQSILNKAILSVTLKEELALKQKWLNISNNQNDLNLSDDDYNYLIEKGKITMCVDPDFLPYEGIKNGKHIGIAADFFEEFQSKLPVPIELIPTKSWAETIQNAKDKKCDIISLLNQSPERGEYLDFTDPYLSDPIVIITRDDVFYLDGIESLFGRTVSITKGYYMNDVLERNFPNIKLIEADSLKDALKDVAEGRAFANVTSILAATRAIQYYGFHNLQIAGQTELRNQFRIGVVKGNSRLSGILNKAVNSIDEKMKNKISQHWYTVGFQHITDWRMVWQISGVALLCLILLLVNIISNKRYNTKITETNAVLQQKNDELNDLRAELERHIKQLNKLAVTDKLTGLFNRVKIDTALKDEFRRSKRFNHFFGVILLDIDNFKDVNDTFGHQVGDEVLIKVASVVGKNTRETDIVGRWGGEEFIIICPEITSFGLSKLAEKLRVAIETTDFIHISSLTASFGITMSKFDAEESITQIVSRADKALYSAKESGRNQVKSS